MPLGYNQFGNHNSGLAGVTSHSRFFQVNPVGADAPVIHHDFHPAPYDGFGIRYLLFGFTHLQFIR